jgi:hypothetical protein
VIRYQGIETALSRFQNQDIFLELWPYRNLALVSGNNHAKFGAYVYILLSCKWTLSLSLPSFVCENAVIPLCTNTS